MSIEEFIEKSCLDNVNELNLGIKNPDLIYSLIQDQNVVKEYIHEQFIEDASTYQKKYTNYDHFFNLLSHSFSKINSFLFQNDNSKNLSFYKKELKILDVGSGSGNTVFPLLDMFPNSLIIASDISIELLRLLKEESKNRGVKNNLGIFQINAENLNFREETFDLVVGASILHHLISPDKTIECCSKILKKGGYAVFHEPFEIGCIFTKIILKDIMSSDKNNELPQEIIDFFKIIINDYEYRVGRDKSRPCYKYMDDKWLFTKAYFEELANQYQFSECLIYSNINLEKTFETHIKSLLNIGLGKTPSILPNWAWDIVKDFDEYFTEDAKSEIILEGCIILKK